MFYLFSYSVLAADAAKSGKDVVDASQKILEELLKRNLLKPEEFQSGKSKVWVSQKCYSKRK